MPVPGRCAGQRAADVAPAGRDPAGQRAEQHAEQFVVAGRAADDEHLRARLGV